MEFRRPANCSNLSEVKVNMRACLFDLQNFKNLYTEEGMPLLWERYIKEGFKNYMTSFLELSKAMMYYSKPQGRMKYTSFKDCVRDYESYRLLPEGSSLVLDQLRELRNQDSHGYGIPEFEDMYQLFVDNEELFEGIFSYCKKTSRKSEFKGN